MARPSTISREKIVEAARTLFLREGINASTQAIARAAGVSEGSIFKRFSTKDDLFEAAMGVPKLEFVAGFSQRVGCGEIREQLVDVCLELVAFFRELIPSVMMVWARGSNPVEAMRSSDHPPPLVILRALADYLAAEIELGRLSARDPELTARVIVGSLHNFAFLETVGVYLKAPIEDRPFCEDLIGLLWDGVAPEQS